MSTETLWIYGIHAVNAQIANAPERIDRLCLMQSAARRLKPLKSAAEAAGITIEWTAKEFFGQRFSGNHQGAAACCRVTAERDEAFLEQLVVSLVEPGFFLVLDNVTDPHNLGACLRSADAAGVHAVIVPRDNAASLTPVARKVACGAAESVPLVRVTNLARTLRFLAAAGVWLVGAAGEAESSVYQADLSGALALVLGSEDKGLRRLTRETCDSLVSLPMAGQVSSLNVSVAAGICLFEAVRQRTVSLGG